MYVAASDDSRRYGASAWSESPAGRESDSGSDVESSEESIDMRFGSSMGLLPSIPKDTFTLDKKYSWPDSSLDRMSKVSLLVSRAKLASALLAFPSTLICRSSSTPPLGSTKYSGINTMPAKLENGGHKEGRRSRHWCTLE